MGVPVVAGIPFVAGIIGGLFGEAVKFLGKFFTKKVAIRLVVVSGLVTMLAGFVALIETLIASLVLVMPSEFAGWVPYIIPTNTSYCISAILTARLAEYAYFWNTRILQYTLPGM